MKKLWLFLCLFVSVLGSVQAHDIPPEILQYIVNNPDGTEAEFQEWMSQQAFEEAYQVWGETDEFSSFNLPDQLVDFLLENQAASEAEVLAYVRQNEALSEWEPVVQKLLAGQTDPADFTTNDLVLLNSLSQTLDDKLQKDSLDWGQFIKNYIKLGVDHILVGLDHVLFVMVLVLLLPPWKKVLAMVTTFTLAHTVTLLLGGTQILMISATIVEPIIAASIAYVAITSVFLRQKFPWLESQQNRLFTIFVFGLFHGLGFAGVFSAVAPDGERLLASLLFFNVGVEVGQLIILAIWLPILWVIYRLKLNKYLIPIVASLISLLALAWVWERLFF